MDNKPTLLLGATSNPERTAYTAVHKLRQHGHTVYPLGRNAGMVDEIEIQTEWPANQKFDTVTIYLNPENQAMYVDKIIALKPNRVIFNPGAENHELESQLLDYDIEVLEECTLVLLATKQF